MRSKLVIGSFTAVVAFLLATNPVVVDAAGQITGAQIKNNSVASKDIKNNSVKGGDIKDGSLTGADVADNSLTGNDISESTLTGVNATTLNALAASAYALVAQPAFTPATLNAGYTQFAGGTTPGFVKDTLGFVHLKGMLNCPPGGTVFTLPVGFRPAQRFFFPMAVGASGAGNIQVNVDGSIVTFNADGAAHPCGLDGATFRTDTTARPSDGAKASNPNN
jgi:hypothetical protein